MTEFYTLLILLAAICLSECLCFVPDGTFAFRLFAKHSARLGQPLFHLGSLGLDVFWGSPVPGRGELAFCATELRMSPRGVCTCRTGGGQDSPGYVEFSDLADVKADGTRIVSASREIVQTSSEIRAKELVHQLHNLRQLDPEARSVAIHKEFRRMLDVPAAKARWLRFRRMTRWLDWNARILLLVMLVIVPLTILFAGWRQALPAVALCLGLSVRQIFIYVRLDRVFQKSHVKERRMRVVTMALSPPATVRIRDFLSRDLFAAFHPLAVARATCDDASAHRFAAQEMRRLQYPADYERHSISCPVASWFDQEWRNVVQNWARREFQKAESLMEPPARQNPASLSYCPRCHEEFVIERAECPDCPGVSLRSFGAVRNSLELPRAFSGQERRN